MYELGVQDCVYLWDGRWDNVHPISSLTCACQMNFDVLSE